MKPSLIIVALTAIPVGSVVVSSAESSAAKSAAASEHQTYKARPGDHISIVVYGHEKLGGTVQVDATGGLRIAGVSERIPAAGLSVADIRAIAESRYKKAGVEDPQVAVFGHVRDGNRLRLVSSVPPTRLPTDSIRSDAKHK